MTEETRLDRIERILEESIKESREWREESRKLRRIIWKELRQSRELQRQMATAIIELVKMQKQSYSGPWEPEQSLQVPPEEEMSGTDITNEEE